MERRGKGMGGFMSLDIFFKKIKCKEDLVYELSLPVPGVLMQVEIPACPSRFQGYLP